MSIVADAGKQQSQGRPIFTYAIAVGVIAGMLWGIEPPERSRFHDYETIRLGMPRQEAVNIVESPQAGLVGCGTLHYENRDSVCRFDDPWREYTINFNPDTGVVNRKRFFFKRIRFMP